MPSQTFVCHECINRRTLDSEVGTPEMPFDPGPLRDLSMKPDRDRPDAGLYPNQTSGQGAFGVRLGLNSDLLTRVGG
jgi:hypothetical protein